MIVKLDLDPRLVFRVEERAEKAGMTFAEYVVDRIAPKQQAAVSAAERTRSEVLRLHAAGFSDAEIAACVDRVQGHVARLRRSAGLKANRRRDG